MIEVVVCVDDVFDGLVWSQFLDLGDDSRRPLFVLRSFDEDQMIGKFDQYAVVALAGEIPETLANFLHRYHRRRGRGRRLCGFHISRCGQVACIGIDYVC